MLSYARILHNAYVITIRNPVLWLFGLFVVGGFNLNFLHYQNINARGFIGHVNLPQLLAIFQMHPEILATICFSILIFSFLGLVVTNWCRIMLVLLVDEILKKKFLDLKTQTQNSRHSVVPVIQISLLTTFFICVAAAGLFIPPLFVTGNGQLRTVLWMVGTVLFVPIIFILSCVNIFTTYFVILFKQKLGSALSLGTDFFISRWSQILGLVAVLMVIYLLSFFVGVSIIYILKVIFGFIFEEWGQYTIFSVSAIIWVPNIVANVLIWLLLAILNVFINTALLLLFFELITPVEFEQNATEHIMEVAPASPL